MRHASSDLKNGTAPGKRGDHDLIIAEILFREATEKLNRTGEPPKATQEK